MWPFRKTETTAQEAGEKRSLANPTDIDFSIFGALPSLTGIVVTPASALAVPAVAAGVRAIAEAASILPLHLYQRNEDGSRKRLSDHPASHLLNDASNPWTGGAQVRELLTADAVAWGNGYAEIVRDREQNPVELHRLYPPHVTVEIDARTGEPHYKVTSGSTTRMLLFSDVLHLRAPSTLATDAVCGRSPLMQAQTAIGIVTLLQQHAAKLFSNGGRPSGVLSTKEKLGTDAIARMKASWQAATTGGSAGGTAVLEQGMDWKAITFNSVDSQFIEIWTLSITEIARVLRVPPVLLMDYSRQTWANAETGGQQFLTYSLAPWLSRWESEVSLKLIKEVDRQKVFAEHLTDALLRADFATRATAYGQYRSMGAMTANEVRGGLNLPKIDGGDTLQNPYTTTDKTAPKPDPKADDASEGQPNE
ncbi:phage portal protein [Rhizobium laguerreae]|uniref:phage portal protein n=1 Tax=Rhizobium laguerreae TaxID=1076926 RepID=UPI00143F157E|nr:phage portal protein [Rhizobium laguerreae]NKM86360.1 phage portal protein [Rhizobium laguerreae]